MFLRTILGVALVLCVGAGHADADELEFAVGRWSAVERRSPETDVPVLCAVGTRFEDNAILALAVSGNDRLVLMASDPAWKLVAGRPVSVALEFDGDSRLDLTARASRTGRLVVRAEGQLKATLLELMRKGSRLQVAMDNGFLRVFPLKDKDDAFRAMVACTKGGPISADSGGGAMALEPARDPGAYVLNGSSRRMLERLRDSSAIREALDAGVLDDGYPPAGPVQTYKWLTMVGSTYPDADNDRFFATVRQAVDMIDTLPPDLRAKGHEIEKIQYDPPSSKRKRRDYSVNILGVYMVGADLAGRAPVVVFQDMKFSSAARVAVSLVGNGIYCQGHMAMVEAGRRIIEQTASARDYRDFKEQVAALTKTDEAVLERMECTSLQSKLGVYEALGIGGRHRNGIFREMTKRGCSGKI